MLDKKEAEATFDDPILEEAYNDLEHEFNLLLDERTAQD